MIYWWTYFFNLVYLTKCIYVLIEIIDLLLLFSTLLLCTWYLFHFFVSLFSFLAIKKNEYFVWCSEYISYSVFPFTGLEVYLLHFYAFIYYPWNLLNTLNKVVIPFLTNIRIFDSGMLELAHTGPQEQIVSISS